MKVRELSFVLCFAACTTQDTPDPKFGALSAAIRADLESSNATAASVALWLDGEIVWVGGYGTADPDGDLAPDEETRFQIGSDTKKLTALSLLRKVAAHELTLDTTVATVLPELVVENAPAFGATTMRELLTHRGGVVDGVELATSATDAGLATFAYGEFASSYYALSPPGAFFNYSNPDFSIAGLVDQTLDGRMWPDIVEQDLFAPLGMTRTVARKTELDDNTAIGRGISAVSPEDPIQRIGLAETWESAFVRPAGLVWSTPSDQIRLAEFLVDGNPDILDPSLLHELTTVQTPMYPDLSPGYGFGLVINQGASLGDDYYDIPVWSHGGITLSYTSAFIVLPEQRFAISILSNGRLDDFSRSVVTAIATLADLPAPSTAPEPPFDASKLDSLAGTYTAFDPDIGELEIIIAHTGTSLTIEIPVLDEARISYDHAMTSVSTRVWIASLGGEAEELSFIDGPNGEMYLRNRQFVGVRVGVKLM